MTDQPVAGDGRRRAPRPPRQGDGRGLVTTVAMLSAAAVAVIAGFLILRSITNETAGSDDAVSDVATTVASTPVTTTSLVLTPTTTTTTTTAPTASKTDATVVVANASGVGGSATAMTAELVAAGYTTAPVANSTGPQLAQSTIYYLEGNPQALGVARLLAQQIPSAQTLPMPEPTTLDRPLGAATVVLMLGRDAAGRSLAELQTG